MDPLKALLTEIVPAVIGRIKALEANDAAREARLLSVETQLHDARKELHDFVSAAAPKKRAPRTKKSDSAAPGLTGDMVSAVLYHVYQGVNDVAVLAELTQLPVETVQAVQALPENVKVSLRKDVQS